MTKRTRTILFLVFLFLFLSAAPMVILYSQGYRIDLKNKKITQTGGLFLKVEPKQVEIYLDDKFAEKTDFFFGSALIENLLPKKYKIEVKKSEYSPWQKSLEIEEKEVQECKNVILFPEKPNFSVLAKNVEKFWPSPDQKKIILEEANPPATGDWALKLYDLDKNVKSQLIDEGDISVKGADLINLEFTENSKEISLEAGVAEKIKYFTLNLDKIPPTLIETQPTTSSENIVVSQKVNNDIYYLDKFGYLFKGPLFSSSNERLNDNPFLIKLETEYALVVFQNFIFLREDKTLYQFDFNSKSFEKFFEGVNSLEVSPDLKKLVYFSDYEIWILFLKDNIGQPQKKAGEKLFVVRLSEKIGDCFWLNNDYLIFNSGDKIKISETDDRDKINIVDIAEFKDPGLFWGQNDKKLYILSEGGLRVSDALLP